MCLDCINKQAIIDLLKQQHEKLHLRLEELQALTNKNDIKLAVLVELPLSIAARAKLDPVKSQHDAWMVADIKKLEEQYGQKTRI